MGKVQVYLDQAANSQQTANLACQWQQGTSRNPRCRRHGRLTGPFEIRCRAPDHATASVRQGDRDELRAAATAEREDGQMLIKQRMARVGDRDRRD
jgi:hypothetical protein